MAQAPAEMQAHSGSGSEAALLARLIVAVPADAIPEIRRRLYETIQEVRSEYAHLGDAPEPDAADENDCARWAITLAFAPVWPSGGGA